MQFLTFSFILLFSAHCLSLKILIYSPRMIPSHVAFVANIANLFARRGHEVTVIDSVLRNDLNNQIDVNLVKRIVQIPTSPNVSNALKNLSVPQTFWNLKIEPVEQKEAMEQLGKIFLEQCTYLFENYQHVLDELENVDFGMHEVFDVCGLGLFEKLNIRKSVILSSTGMRDMVSEALGIESSIFTSSILSDYGSFVPFLGIRRNLQFHSAWRNFFKVQMKPLEKMLNFNKSFEELLGYSNLMFLNTHEVADCRREWSRRVHEIGGICFKEPKELTEDFTQLFSKFSKVVMVSFGTTTPSFLMPMEYKLNLIKVFSKLKNILFIWKYEKEDEFTENCKEIPNVVFRKFVPQVHLLESHRISLFVTHGGQNSLLETFHAGTPALVVPLFGDQHRNAQIAKENHLVTVMNKEDLANEEVVEEAIKRGIEGDKRLATNLSKVSSVLRNAKAVSESLLIATVETTYSSLFPPNFQSSQRSWRLNCDTYLLLLDIAFSTLICIIMMFIISRFTC